MTAEQAGLAPLAVVAIASVVVLASDAVFSGERKAWLAPLAAGGVIVALAFAIYAAGILPQRSFTAFNGSVAIDDYALFFQVVFLLLGLLVLMLAPAYLADRGLDKGEFYILFLAALAGMMVTVAAASLLTLFIGIELLSLSLYVLSGFLRERESSQEAAVKYLLIGGFASGFLLYGMALLYGGTGTIVLTDIAARLPHLAHDNLILSIGGVGLVLVGLAYKSSAAPFHAWTPDVYQGAPAPVVAFMSVGTKIAAIGALLRLFVISLPAVHSRWSLLLGSVAALSMLIGALGALRQTGLKRLLAYSSINHAGYLLLAPLAANRAGMVGGLFYLAAYGVMTFGAFAIASLLAPRESDEVSIASLRGIGYQRRWLGALLALFLVSLAGFPPTVGFWGKLFVFLAVIRAGYVNLALIAIVTTAISLYYYVRIFGTIYAPASGEEDTLPAERGPAELLAAGGPADAWGVAAVVVVGALTIALGIFPGLLYGLAQKSSLL